jgi:AraC-like DNA-binding protein/mannose-6-phosphate isomerase-like protein (cupin superfamily)
MPIVSSSPSEWANPKALAYLEAVTSEVVVYASRGTAPPWQHARHEHHQAQLFFVLRGSINCDVEDTVWAVPAQCALWIPPGLPHAAQGSGNTECGCVFIAPEAARNLPKECCTFAILPLLRELLLKAASLPETYAADGPESRLLATLLDELAVSPMQAFHLPIPREPRLRRLAVMMLAAPADRGDLASWSARLGMSMRNLSRLFLDEVGISFGRWRRQLDVVLSLQRLSAGESVETVAFSLGYKSAGSFITMFRKTVGRPPAQYLAELHPTASCLDQRPWPRKRLRWR